MNQDTEHPPLSTTDELPRRPASRWPRLAISVAVLFCLFYLGSEVFVFSHLAFPLDDSWIHLQFARQLAEGHGLTYNGGAWVPGSTAPLWTALLSVGFLLPINALAWAKLLGILAFLGTIVGSDRLAIEFGLQGSLRTLSTLSVASCHWLIWSALSGMEICLFVCASLWGLVFHLRERRTLCRPGGKLRLRSLFLFTVASLLRPEGMLLLLLAFCDRAFTWQRDEGQLDERLLDEGQRDGETMAPDGEATMSDRGLRLRWASSGQALRHGSVLCALLLLPSVVFNYLSSGSFFATTLAVKGGGGGWLPDGGHLQKVLTILFTAQPTLLLFAGAGCLVLVQRLGSTRDQGLLPALWLIGFPLANAILSPNALGNFGRYYFPLLPLVAILGALGVSLVWEHIGDGLTLGRSGSSLRLPLRAGLLLLLLAPIMWGALQGIPRYLQTLSNVEDSDVRAAHWLAPRLPPGASLAVQDIGALKFWLPNPVIDLAGIVTPEVQPILAAGRGQGATYWEQRLFDYLATQRPDYLVVFPNSYPLLTQPASGFREVKRFDVEQNVTMAGSRLVIYSTPWNQHPLTDMPEKQ